MMIPQTKEYKTTMMRTFHIFSLSFVMLFCVQLHAQHNTSSPYSMFGIGEIETSGYGMNSGMANTGIGLYIPGFLNTANPAATIVDSLSFIFDVSTSARLSRFSYSGTTERATSANLKKIAIGFRTIPKLSVTIGVMPYSNVEYKIKTSLIVEGTSQNQDMLHEGNGGFTQAYLAGSYKLHPKLHVGARASYLFGNINNTQTTWSQNRHLESTGKKLIMDFGLIYNNQLDEQTHLTVGATYGYKSKVKLNHVRTVSINNVPEVTPPTYVYLPQSAGVGASVQKIMGHSYSILALDYKFTDRSGFPSPEKGVYYKSSHRVSAGAQYTPNYRTPKNYFQRVAYQLGGFIDYPCMRINGSNLMETGVSLGMNFPLSKGSRTVMFFSADFVHRGGKNLINENYCRINLGVSLNETWFIKWVYD
jgi:hypothetical protein